MKYEELRESVEILGLGDCATLDEIKSAYRRLIKKFHPDKTSNSESYKLCIKLNKAYRTILSYCKHYKFSFTKEEFYKQYPEERLKEQFFKDPLW